MKTIEEVQRFKQEKCTLLLQTAECCDISEIIEQLKVRNKSNSRQAAAVATNADTARNILIKKFNQNYVTIDALKNGVTTTSQTSFLDLSPCPKSMGSGYKVLPKYIQNIDSIGFEKPNWKPLMLNEKMDSSQFSGMAITNSLQSFRGGKVTYRSNKAPLNSQRDFNKLDAFLNSHSHKQKSLEMNRKRIEQHRETGSSLLSSSSVNEFSNELTQSDCTHQQIAPPKLLPSKRLLLGPSKLKLSSTLKQPVLRRSSTVTMESSQENFEDLLPVQNASNGERLPLLKQVSVSTEREPFLHDNSSASISMLSANVNKTNNNSKLSFYETDGKHASTMLADVISISKISPTNKQRRTSTTTESESTSDYTTGHEVNSKPNAESTSNEENGFFSNILKQKSELEAYLNQVREKTSLSHAPPNSPMPYEISRAQVNIRGAPSTPQEEIRLLRVSDTRKFPPTNSVGIPIASSLQLRRRKQQLITLNENSQAAESRPLIKTPANHNACKKLEKNLEKKIGQNSVNMIKLNNKNVKFLSNIGSQNSVSSSSLDESTTPTGFGTPSKKLMNDKLRIDIYIPNLS